MSTTTTQVASSAASITLIAGNPNRVKAPNTPAVIANDSTAVLYLLYGPGTASTTNYSETIDAKGTAAPLSKRVPEGYTGPVQAIWASANGFAYVTEFS